MRFGKIGCLFLLINMSFAGKAQTADDIISKYITFTGGEQQWKNVHTIVTSGIYNYGGIEYPFTTYSKAPDLYKFVVPFQGKYFAQAFDGKAGWKIDAFKGETKKTLLTGKDALALMNEADVELESPFVNYKSKGHQAMLQGVDTVNGANCFKIKFITSNADTSTYFFNTDNYALIKKQAVSKNAELDKSLLDVFYTNYQPVNGINIPFVQTYKSNGQNILIITTQKAEINVAIDDAEFKP